MPSTSLQGASIDQVDIYSNEIGSGESLNLKVDEPTFGLVAEGIVVVKVEGGADQRVVAGQSFSLAKSGSNATIVNVSSELPAKVITFKVI